jgi:hypothetical protein
MKELENLLPKPARSLCELKVQDRDEIQQTVIGCLSTAHSIVAVCFEGIPLKDDVRRQMVKDFFNSDQIRKIEAAIDGEISVAMNADLPGPQRSLSRDRVREGMEYWKNLILKRMGC